MRSGGKQLVEFSGRRRVGVQEALHELAAERAQDLGLFGEFDAFRDDHQIEITAQREQGPEETRGFGIGVDVGDECDIDLDRPK